MSILGKKSTQLHMTPQISQNKKVNFFESSGSKTTDHLQQVGAQTRKQFSEQHENWKREIQIYLFIKDNPKM